MNWKVIMTSVVAFIIGMIVYEMFVKKYVSGLEGYLDYDAGLDGYTEKIAS